MQRLEIVANRSKALIVRPSSILNYLIVVLLILQQDSPYFLATDINRLIWAAIMFLLLLLVIKKKKRILHPKIFLILTTTWVLIFIQYYLYGGGFTPAIIYKPVWLFYTTYLVYLLIGEQYYKYLFNVVYFVAVYTSILYLMHTLIPPFNTMLMSAFDSMYQYSWADWPRTILIYSVPQDSGYMFMRNSGIFHEAGAYGIYLILAIILNTLYTGKPFSRKNIFLASVALTTFSTVTYIMLFSYYSFHVISTKTRSIIIKPIVLTMFIIITFTVYRDAQFLQEKIYQRYETQMHAVKDGKLNVRGRFYALMMTGKSISESPIFGRGIISENKYDVGDIGSFGYGLGGLFARYGLIFGVIYAIYYYQGYQVLSIRYNQSKSHGTIMFFVINLGLMSQIFFFHSPFIYPLFIKLFMDRKETTT
jgi:hypothetical protein